MRRGRLVGASLGLVWFGAVAAGLIVLWNYENAPGIAAEPPAHWPARSALRHVAGVPTLVMLVHPHCPCSRASLEELDRLMAHLPGVLIAHVLFVKPAGVPADWEQTDLWRRAASIPGVSVTRDDGGVEAQWFDAATSGQTVVYDGDDRLLFSGGITAARGHEGDNPGRTAILSVLASGPAEQRSTPVFGCSLRGGI
ncbi:MAG: RedB protein [Deltaproteobacteria bacterium]|nr:MAG: RedB protein [Deltaproteobacteria bacterium]TMA54057.1 MAG: RedB protein [Deltaproteobacteria bacterium]